MYTWILILFSSCRNEEPFVVVAVQCRSVGKEASVNKPDLKAKKPLCMKMNLVIQASLHVVL